MFGFQCHWCIHSLPHSLIHPFHSFLTQFPSKELSHETSEIQTVAVNAAPPRRKAYIQWGAAWFRKGRTMVLRFIFKTLGLITIFLKSNKKRNRQILIHCSKFVISVRARAHTHTHTQNTNAVAASIIPKIYVAKVAKITAQTVIN